MKGHVLHYDDNLGSGQISGADGIRYNFGRADLKRLVPIAAGTEVDFDFEGKEAKDIYVVSSMANMAGVATEPYRGEIEPDLGFIGYFRRAITAYYFNFSGRARRKEYWSFMVLPILVYMVLGTILVTILAGRAASPGETYEEGFVILLVLGVFSLGMIIPALAVQVRRLHDIGQSGWLLLLLLILALIPIFGLLSVIAYIVLGCIDSQPQANKYGPPPKRFAV